MQGEMKVADKVILVLNDGDYLAVAISGGLHPHPNSDLQTMKDHFEFPLEHYGINDSKASGQIIHYVTPNGHYKVSIIFLKNYEPPVLACALNEVLLKLSGSGDISTMPTFIVPIILPESKLKQENKYLVISEKVSVHGIKLGPTTDVAQALSSRLRNSSESVRIHHEHLALLVHLLNVMKLPTVVLVGLNSQHVSNKNSKEEFEVICEIGEHLASVSSLCFSKEKIIQNPTETSRDSEEAWRALYG